MGWWIAAAAIGTQLYGGASAKKAAKRTAGRQADAYRFSAKEELRRLGTAQRLNMERLDLNMAASGVMQEGSADRFKFEFKREQDRQYEQQRQADYQNLRSIRAGGNAQGRALQQTANLNAINTGIGYMSSYWNSQNQGGGSS